MLCTDVLFHSQLTWREISMVLRRNLVIKANTNMVVNTNHHHTNRHTSPRHTNRHTNLLTSRIINRHILHAIRAGTLHHQRNVNTAVMMVDEIRRRRGSEICDLLIENLFDKFSRSIQKMFTFKLVFAQK